MPFAQCPSGEDVDQYTLENFQWCLLLLFLFVENSVWHRTNHKNTL